MESESDLRASSPWISTLPPTGIVSSAARSSPLSMMLWRSRVSVELNLSRKAWYAPSSCEHARAHR